MVPLSPRRTAFLASSEQAAEQVNQVVDEGNADVLWRRRAGTGRVRRRWGWGRRSCAVRRWLRRWGRAEDGGGHRVRDRRHRALLADEGIPPEVLPEDLLRGPGGKGLCGQGGVRTAEAVRQGGVVGDEEPLYEAGLGVDAEHGVGLVQPHAH